MALGIVPWFTLTPTAGHQIAFTLAVLYLAGLALESPRAQVAIVIANFLLVVTGFHLIRW